MQKFGPAGRCAGNAAEAHSLVDGHRLDPAWLDQARPGPVQPGQDRTSPVVLIARKRGPAAGTLMHWAESDPPAGFQIRSAWIEVERVVE